MNLFSRTITAIFVFFMMIASCSASTPSLTKTEVLQVLFKHSSMSLLKGKHCKHASAIESAKNLGDYISSHWVLHADKEKKNWLDIKSLPVSAGNTKVTVMLYSEYLEEEGNDKWLRQFGNGLSFVVDKNKEIVKNSLMCIGTD